MMSLCRPIGCCVNDVFVYNKCDRFSYSISGLDILLYYQIRGVLSILLPYLLPYFILLPYFYNKSHEGL